MLPASESWLSALPHLLTYPHFYQWLRLFVLYMNRGMLLSAASCLNLQERYERWLIAQATSYHSVFLVAEDEAQSAEQPGQLVAFLVATVEREYHGGWREHEN